MRNKAIVTPFTVLFQHLMDGLRKIMNVSWDHQSPSLDLNK
jgi:hypothetical protein